MRTYIVQPSETFGSRSLREIDALTGNEVAALRRAGAARIGAIPVVEDLALLLTDEQARSFEDRCWQLIEQMPGRFPRSTVGRTVQHRAGMAADMAGLCEHTQRQPYARALGEDYRQHGDLYRLLQSELVTLTGWPSEA